VFTEYALLIGLVAAVIVGMQVYARRGIQAVVKQAADDLSPYQTSPGGDPEGERAQLAGMQYEAGDRTTSVTAEGRVLVRESAVQSATDRTHQRTPAFDETVTTSGALAHRGGAVSYQEVIVDTNE